LTEPITVADGRVVLIHYVLTDDEGAVIDRSSGEPLAYLHGHHGIVSGLERALAGAHVGQQIRADVAPAEGYGEVDPDATISVHRSELPPGLEVEVGMALRGATPDGRPAIFWVERTVGARVTLTRNHPLAGKTLHFDVTIAGIRDATSEELAHGHVHGPGGHHHG
jgi:FKBP-type peptidyl-prolyl cis-trans isomerase SlyD